MLAMSWTVSMSEFDELAKRMPDSGSWQALFPTSRPLLVGHAANSNEREFFDCATSYQGISVGWVDQYHQATDGQQLDLTGVPEADDYYLVSTANYAGVFLEKDYSNNTAWVKFRLYRDSNGNRKVEVLDHSPCAGGLCGESAPNR